MSLTSLINLTAKIAEITDLTTDQMGIKSFLVDNGIRFDLSDFTKMSAGDIYICTNDLPNVLKYVSDFVEAVENQNCECTPSKPAVNLNGWTSAFSFIIDNGYAENKEDATLLIEDIDLIWHLEMAGEPTMFWSEDMFIMDFGVQILSDILQEVEYESEEAEIEEVANFLITMSDGNADVLDYMRRVIVKANHLLN